MYAVTFKLKICCLPWQFLYQRLPVPLASELEDSLQVQHQLRHLQAAATAYSAKATNTSITINQLYTAQGRRFDSPTVGPGSTHFSVIQSGLPKAGQQTLSDKDVHLSVFLTGRVKKRPEKKNAFSHYCVLQDSPLFSSYIFLLVTRLVRSSYYRAIFNIFTGQERDEFELRFIWSVSRLLVNTTGNSPKFIFCLVQWNPENTKHLGNSKLVGIYREVWEIECKITVFD